MKRKLLRLWTTFFLYLNKGHQRTIKAKKNIIASIAIKGVDVCIGILLVPLFIKYLGQTKYGIWLTISSISTWFSFMDGGLGLGLMNKFGKAIAQGKTKEARTYVSTTYAIVLTVVVSFLIIFIIVNSFLPWAKILNANTNKSFTLYLLALIVFGFFAIRLLAQLFIPLMIAQQKPIIRYVVKLTDKVLILASILILLYTTSGSLIYFSLFYSGLPVFFLFVMTLYFFNQKYKCYSPSIHFIDLSYAKKLTGLSAKFFIIKIAMVVIFSTDNIIISQLFGPRSVTPYQVTRKYFFLSYMLFMIIMSPVWSACIEAFEKDEYNWIKSTIHKLYRIFIVFTFATVMMLLMSNNVFNIWVGKSVKIPFLLSSFWAMFIILQMFNAIYFHIINGSGKVKLQTIVYSVGVVLNIPLSIIFAKTLKLGISGIILATLICQSLHLLYLPKQYNKIINKRDFGIWSK